MTVRPPAPGDAMLHPAVLGAIVVLVVNDHVLKAAASGTSWAVLTGKVSDVAGLVFFPLLVWSLGEAALAVVKKPWGPSRRALVAAVVVTGVVFALTKTWAPAGELYRLAWGTLQWPARAFLALVEGRAVPGRASVRFIVDPTDLLALPALLVAFIVGARRCRVTT